jgi:hypothetical protein
MKIEWTKSGRDWFGIYGRFRAEVRGPNGPLGFCHWSVRASEQRGGSGGTSSVRASKRAAENEIVRFSNFLTTKATGEKVS